MVDTSSQSLSGFRSGYLHVAFRPALCKSLTLRHTDERLSNPTVQLALLFATMSNLTLRYSCGSQKKAVFYTNRVLPGIEMAEPGDYGSWDVLLYRRRPMDSYIVANGLYVKRWFAVNTRLLSKQGHFAWYNALPPHLWVLATLTFLLQAFQSILYHKLGFADCVVALLAFMLSTNVLNHELRDTVPPFTSVHDLLPLLQSGTLAIATHLPASGFIYRNFPWIDQKKIDELARRAVFRVEGSTANLIYRRNLQHVNNNQKLVALFSDVTLLQQALMSKRFEKFSNFFENIVLLEDRTREWVVLNETLNKKTSHFLNHAVVRLNDVGFILKLNRAITKVPFEIVVKELSIDKIVTSPFSMSDFKFKFMLVFSSALMSLCCYLCEITRKPLKSKH